MKPIRKVAILGAGTMGARIAAHLANAGVPSFLLDIVPPDAGGRFAQQNRRRRTRSCQEIQARSLLRAPLSLAWSRSATSKTISRSSAKCDWIIEAVVENLDIKRALLKKVEAVRKPGTIITTNTSGLPVAKIAEGFSEDFRRYWFGTHFFNPPRYMRLLELIPTPDTDPRR